MTVARVVYAASFLLVVVALWCFVRDVHVDVGGRNAFCGSAYDVVLLKGDGYMGGEPPANQQEVDRACVVAAGRYVAAGSAVAGVAVVLPLTMAGRGRRGGMTP